MKTVFITASPKKRWSNSSYLLSITKGFTKGEKVWVNFRGPKDYTRIFSELDDADALVLGMPLYVDAVPSHVLVLLEALEKYVKSRQLHFKVYSLCNCGFYEGVQCELELEVIECWCEKCNLKFCGGAGIGAGEMLGVLRLSPVIGLIEMLVEFVIRLIILKPEALAFSEILHCLNPLGVLISILVFVLFSIGPWICAANVGRSVTKLRSHKISYSTVSFCPAFSFVFFASIYWVLRAFIIHFIPVWKLFRKV